MSELSQTMAEAAEVAERAEAVEPAEPAESAERAEPAESALHRQKHETYAIDARPLLISGLVLVLLGGMSFFLMDRLFIYFEARQQQLDSQPSPLAETRPLPPEPRLQVTPVQDVQILRTEKEHRLNNYAWVNKEAGIVRLPIERAIELVAERGLPVRGLPVRSGNDATQERIGP